jgi:hypothetical protein
VDSPVSKGKFSSPSLVRNKIIEKTVKSERDKYYIEEIKYLHDAVNLFRVGISRTMEHTSPMSYLLREASLPATDTVVAVLPTVYHFEDHPKLSHTDAKSEMSAGHLQILLIHNGAKHVPPHQHQEQVPGPGKVSGQLRPCSPVPEA